MKRLVAALVVTLCVVAACDNKTVTEDPSGSAPPGAAPPRVRTAAGSPAAAAPSSVAAAPPPGPGAGTTEDRRGAVLRLIAGETSAQELPVVATEPGERLDPSLRSFLPSVSRERIWFGKMNVFGDLTPAVVRRIVERPMPGLRACYRRGLMSDPSLGGRINLQLVIRKNGQTASAKSESADLADKQLVWCVERIIERLRYPKSDTGQVSRVSLPVHFMPN